MVRMYIQQGLHITSISNTQIMNNINTEPSRPKGIGGRAYGWYMPYFLIYGKDTTHSSNRSGVYTDILGVAFMDIFCRIVTL